MANPHNEFVVSDSDKDFSDSWPQSVWNLFTDHMHGSLLHEGALLSSIQLSVILLGEGGKEKA